MDDRLIVSEVKQLSDEDLGQRLKERHGFEPGPITKTTRNVYEKKLIKFEAESMGTANGNQAPIATSTPASFAAITHGNGSSRRSSRRSLPVPVTVSTGRAPESRFQEIEEESDSSTATATPRPRGLISMDDYEAPKRRGSPRSARRQTVASTLPVQPPRERKDAQPTLATYSSAESGEDEEGSFGGSSERGGAAASSPALGSHHKLVKKKHPSSPPSFGFQRPSNASKVPLPRVSSARESAATLSNREPLRRLSPRNKRVTLTPNQPTAGPSLANFSDSETENDVAESLSSPPGTETGDSIKERLLRHRQNLTGRKSAPLAGVAGSLSGHSVVNQSNDFDNNFYGGSSFSGPSSNSSSSNTISFTILGGIISFFVLIFVYYCYSRISFTWFGQNAPQVKDSLKPVPDFSGHRLDPEIDYSSIKAPLCSDQIQNQKEKFKHCIGSKEDIKPALTVIREVRNHISSRLLKYNCDSSADVASNPSIYDLRELRAALMPRLSRLPEFTSTPIRYEGEDEEPGPLFTERKLFKAFSDALTLIQLNPEFKLFVVKDSSSSITHLQVNPERFPVEMPLSCRMYLTVVSLVWKLSLVAVIVGVAVGCYYFYNQRKRRANEEQDMIYDLVEKSLELLQSPDEPKSMPVLHIRDALLSPIEKKSAKYRKIWAKVVKFVEENESRVKVELANIEGEDYKAWQWISTGSASRADSIRDRTSSVMKTGSIEWQGQAFMDEGPEEMTDGQESINTTLLSSGRVSERKSKVSPTHVNNYFVAPTPFLKVRNMFDRETRVNDPLNWEVNIKNGLLEKCLAHSPNGSHGILHMTVDDRNEKNEGLVYLKCDSIESASNAFNALHGWWCEKKLVSVRFLKEERYYQRFPEATTASMPLQVPLAKV